MDERRLVPAFVELADNLVDDFDLIDFLALLTDRCVGTLRVAATGVLLADRDGVLRVMASSSDEARLMELLQVQNDSGPCLTCFRTGQPVTIPDLTVKPERWPRFAEAAQRHGFTSVQALPMRLREKTVGALNLFHTALRPLDPQVTKLAQAMADVATISVLQQRAAEDQGLLTRQLETALDTRVVIEQAKGKLAERYNLSMEEAFTLLRGYARSHNLRLTELATVFVDGTRSLPDLRPNS
ncbi:GAF and ANTAR domain-containing protein [Streptomyces boncukensis]|uniref:GAF and ANTAR domain-containing protein n=1 Tax=Streptomyces boncukensis TaxID=2711219 RepID=A0A6G4WWJ6_9ACTN|nr:GAF and ANTAR domain-containing protein [Streptomyces boncukensis]NGO69659.1 GAF and ANTAR domain-containing protein [Streptomyces boncukensis]